MIPIRLDKYCEFISLAVTFMSRNKLMRLSKGSINTTIKYTNFAVKHNHFIVIKNSSNKLIKEEYRLSEDGLKFLDTFGINIKFLYIGGLKDKNGRTKTRKQKTRTRPETGRK